MATVRNSGEGPRAKLRTGTRAPICGGVNGRPPKHRPFHKLRERPKARDTQINSEKRASLYSAEREPTSLDRSGWGPGGRRFSSGLPDQILPAKRGDRLAGAWEAGSNFGPRPAS